MPTINALLNGINNIDYSSLQKLSNGTYNKGEIDLKRGLFGKYSFDKINNHVGYYANENTEVRTEEQNRTTRAAVFKSILTRFAGRDEADRVQSVLGHETEDINDGAMLDQLGGFHNPYIKEAYKFLLGDGGAALTRDEMRCLDSLLKGAEDEIKKDPHHQFSAGEVEYGVGVLNRLTDIKSGRSAYTGDMAQWIKGLSVTNLSETKEARVMGVSANVFANAGAAQMDEATRVMARYMPELYNACLENVMQITEGFGSRATSSDILKFMNTLLSGISDKIDKGWEVYSEKAGTSRTVSKEDIKAKVREYIKDRVENLRFQRLETICNADEGEKAIARGKMTLPELILFNLIDDTQGDISDADVLRGDSFADY